MQYTSYSFFLSLFFFHFFPHFFPHLLPGYAEGVLPARLSLDPVFAVQRPLYFYLAIAALNAVTHLLMRHGLGFTRLKKYDAESQYVYFRPATNSTAGAKKVPLVFVHGIGIGFAHYLPLIASFPTDTDVFLVEWPHVGKSFTDSRVFNSFNSAYQFVLCLRFSL